MTSARPGIRMATTWEQLGRSARDSSELSRHCTISLNFGLVATYLRELSSTVVSGQIVRPSRDDESMGRAAVEKAFADIHAAYAVLSAELEGTGSGAGPDADPLQGTSDLCLGILAGAARSEPQMAGLKARAAAKYAANLHSMAPPDAPAMAGEASVAAEIACVLTIGPRAAGAFLFDSHELTTRLPLTLAALQAGTMSWQHARVMVDETASLDPAGAAALEAHFLDPAAPNPASGCPAGDMPASRFRHKARIWRERHHGQSIEKRHATSVLDRRVEYAPDRDGMAWLSAYLPRTRPRRSGTASPPFPGACRDPTRSATSPRSGPTSTPPPSSAAGTAAALTTAAGTSGRQGIPGRSPHPGPRCW